MEVNGDTGEGFVREVPSSCYWSNVKLALLPLQVCRLWAVHSNLDHNFILESKKIQDNQLSRKNVIAKELVTSLVLH